MHLSCLYFPVCNLSSKKGEKSEDEKVLIYQQKVMDDSLRLFVHGIQFDNIPPFFSLPS